MEIICNGYKKKSVVATSDPLVLVAEKTKVSKSREKVIVQSESEGGDDEDISDLKKITALLAKAFNRKKYYAKPINNNLRTSASSLANKKLEYVKSEKKKEDKKADEKKRDMSKVKCYNCKKEGHFAKDCKKAKDQAWMESSSDSNQEISANMVFMAKIEKVLSDSEESSSSAEETIAEVSYYTSNSESESEYETSDYYDNSTNYDLFVDKDDDQEILHDAIESASENFNENHFVSQKDHDESEVDHNESEDKNHLINKLIVKFNQKIAKCQNNQVNTFEEKSNEFNKQIKVLNEKNDDLLSQTEVLQEKHKVKHVVIDIHTKCQAHYAKLKKERYQYMIRYSTLCDNDKQHRKKIDKHEILFDKMNRQLVKMNNNVLRLQEKILEKQTKILELEQCVRNKDLEIKKCLERLNDYENKLHKIGQTRQTIHMIMHSKDKMYNGRKGIGFENRRYFCKAKELRPSLYYERVIGLGYTPMFLTHSDDALEIEKFKKARENKIEFAYDYGDLNESYVNEKINLSDGYFQEIINLDFEKIDSSSQQTSSLKPCNNLENSKVIAPINVSQSVSPISVSKTSCASNNVENKTKRKRYLDTLSSVRRPKHSGVIWKKKWSSNTSSVDLSSVSNSKLNKDVKRYSHKDLLSCNNSRHVDTRSAYACNDAINVSCNSRLYASYDVNDLFVFDDVSIRNSRASKTPFRNKPRDSLNVRSKNKLNNFLPRTLFRWFPKMKPLAEPIAKWIPKIVQICLWIIDLGCSKHMTGNRALLMNFVKKFLEMVRFGNNDFAVIVGYGDVVIGSMTIKKVYYVEGKIHQKHHKSKMAFASNKPLYLLHMDLCGPMCVESINGKRYVLVVVDDYSRCYLLINYDDIGKLKAKGDIGVFVGYSKESAAFRIYNKRTQKIHESVNVNFDEISEMASKQFKTSKKDLKDLFHNFYDEYFDTSKIMKSLTTNVETSNEEISPSEEENFHESFESFQEEYSSSSLNADVQQSSEEVKVPPTNTQSVSNESVPNVNEASTSQNVFNERLEDAYFDASMTFHDPSNIHTFYQPYPHEKNIEPANVAEALKDVNWVSAIQEELNQFARLKVWRLVPRPKGKTIINTKWIFKNKKDESSIDYDETFAHVARIKAIRLFLAYDAHKDFTVFQMDVKTIFLNGILKEEVYVGQPLGYVSKQYPDHVYALDKALYGLKQAPRACMMGEMKFFLGLQVNQFSNGIFINQSKYILDILKRLGMENCDTVPTPMVEQAKLKLHLVGKPIDLTDYRSMIRSLMYLTSSRPDIMFATYADHAGCHLDRKSTYGSVQFLGDKLVCWSSKKQNYVSISNAEYEYVAVSGCCAQVLWMRTQLTDYSFFYDKVPIYCDLKSAIAISCNPVQHTRTKHIDVRYHFIKDRVEKGTIELYFVGTEYQLADLFTKSLPEARFKFLVEKLEFMIIVGADNRPPMLEKSMYDSWKSRMELYMENMENRRMILNSVQNGPLKIKDVKVEDVSLTCDTSLEVFNNEVNQLSGMDDDSEHEADDDIGDDEVELTNEESSDDMDEVAEVFRIDTNLFNFETPIPMKITGMIGSMNGTRMYHG
ncbi:retrovirus-related pol polyprotein from transposon TNT 1-94 [Tanacetum coccineum]